MLHKRRWLHLLIITSFLAFKQASGSGFTSLKLGADSRSAGFGMAFTALADDGSAGFWNPAGLAWMKGGHLLITHHQWIFDVQSEFIGIGTGWQNKGIGFNILYTSMGDLELRKTPDPEPLGTFSAYELVAGISYAQKITDRISLGTSLKLYYEKIFIDEVLGLGGDIGLLFRVWNHGLRIGTVIQNMGKTGNLRNEPVPLPLTGKIGFAYPFKTGWASWLLVFDGMKEKDSPFHFQGGFEFALKNRFFLRNGFQTGYETRRITAGAGFTLARTRIDYSLILMNSGLGDAHRISIGIDF